METLDKIDHFGAWFDAFLKHGSLVSLMLAILGGWFVAITAKFPIHKGIADDGWATWLTRLTCIIASALLTLWTWPEHDPGAWAVVAGAGSPILWGIFMAALKWARPTWFDALKLKRVSFIDADEVENDVRPPEPRSDTH